MLIEAQQTDLMELEVCAAKVGSLIFGTLEWT